MSGNPVAWSTMAREILNRIKDNADCEAFFEPVPWKEMGLDDYPQIVTHPMDVKTMSAKLKKAEYKTAEEFFIDLNRIWSNCMDYNQPGSELYNLASRMQGESNKWKDDFFARRRKFREEVQGETVVDRVARRLGRLDSENLAKVVQFIRHQAPSCVAEEQQSMDEEGTLININLSNMDELSLKYTNQLIKELLKHHQ